MWSVDRPLTNVEASADGRGTFYFLTDWWHYFLRQRGLREYDAEFGNCKIGYDVTNDNDIDDAGDDVVWDESWGGTSISPVYDHAGNMIDDGTFRYVYDAWNRLVSVKSSQDSGAVLETRNWRLETRV